MKKPPGDELFREATISGITLPILAATACLAGMLFSQPSLILSGLVILTARLIGIRLARVNMTGLSVKHRHPCVVREKQEFTLHIAVLNDKSWTHSFDVEVSHEIMMNARQAPLHCSSIGGKDVAERRVTTRINQRGLYTRFICTLSSTYPFGFILTEKQFSLEGRIVVAPTPIAPPDILHLLSAGSQESQSRDSFLNHTAGEFKSMREYRHGDHAKNISWPRSIQLNQLIIRECEHYAPSQAAIIFHSYQPPGTVIKKQNFERSLQQLAGLSEYLCEQTIPFEFIAGFQEWRAITVRGDGTSVEQMMESLAAAVFRPDYDMDEVIASCRRLSGHSAALIIVSTTPIQYWSDLIPRTHNQVICMDNHHVMAWGTSIRLQR